MRLATIGDLHVVDGELDTQGPVLDEIAAGVEEARPDLVLVVGDLSGHRVPHKATPRERNALVGFFAKLAQCAPVVIVRGNHDYPRDWEFLNAIGGHSFYSIGFVDEPSTLTAGKAGALALVACFPWVDRSRFGPDVDYGEAVRTLYDAVVDEARSTIATLPDDELPNAVVALGHCAIAGGMIGIFGQPSVPTADPVVAIDDVCPSDVFDAGFFGHYHAPQELPREGESGGAACRYVGSAFVSQHGEATAKSWGVVDISGEGKARAREIPIPQAPRVLLRVDGVARRIVEIVPAALVGLSAGTLIDECKPIALPRGAPSASVKVRIEGAISITEAARAFDEIAALVAPAAHSIKREFAIERVARAREGADEIAKATTTADKLARYLDTINPAPRGVIRKRAIALLAEIEATLDAPIA